MQKYWCNYKIIYTVFLLAWQNRNASYDNYFTTKQELAYSGIQVLPAWRLDREMRRRLVFYKKHDLLVKVFYFLLYWRQYFLFVWFLNWFSTRVRKYLCACINTHKFKGLDSRDITSLPDIKKVIYRAHNFNHQKLIACLSEDLFAYSESL